VVPIVASPRLLSSMTGFARADGSNPLCSWTWEAKSVNAKGLDVRFRLGTGFDHLQGELRDRIQKQFSRGNISINLQTSWIRQTVFYNVNDHAIARLRVLIPDLSKAFPEATPPTIDGLLALKGVMEINDEQLNENTRACLDPDLIRDFETMLGQLHKNRLAEGAYLAKIIEEYLDQIDALRALAETLAETFPEIIKKRLLGQVRELVDEVPSLTEEKLAQEVALLMLRTDVREELDRIKAHLESARILLDDKCSVGRRLDFLCQEFNREANTLCSKSSHISLTQIGLDLKAKIEQMREQVQNIE